MRVSIRIPGGEDATTLEVDDTGRWRDDSMRGEPDLGRDWWCLPGLADAHSHLAADDLNLEPGDPAAIRRRAFASLEGGVFLVVDKGWNDDSVVLTLSEIGPDARPDFEAAGRMIAVEGGYYPGFGVETDADGLASVVADAAATGRGWVKLVGDWPRRGQGALANFGLEELSAAVEVAHRAGARVSIHTMAPEVPSMAVAAGVDSIEHGLFLTSADLDLLASRGGAWVPTVVRMEATADMLGASSSGARLIREGLENVAALLPSAPPHVAVLAGTDLAVPTYEVGREVEALIELGLSPERALAAASTAVRSYLGLPEGFRTGDPADAVFYPTDPLDSPEVLSRPVAVLRGGVRLR
jgi:imidazolonepropionase-like amidohydrolase